MADTDSLGVIERYLISSAAKSLLRREVPFPATSFSLREAAAELDLKDKDEEPVAELERDALALRALADGALFPVVGVAGMLNGGKSSTICLFLSDAGRRRVLVGETREHGTQRFVLWMPERLRHDPATLQDFVDSIQREFGTAPELLSDNPDEAKRQYNTLHDRISGRSLFGTPLLAFDPQLDELGFGLLDCPDVQRSHGDAPSPGAVRLNFLRRAAKFLAGVCFVSRPEGLEDGVATATLQTIVRELPGLPVVALVNMAIPRNWDGPKAMKALAGTLEPVTKLDRAFLAFHADALAPSSPVSPDAARDAMVLPDYQRIDDPAAPETLVTYFHSLDPKQLALTVTESKRGALANRLTCVHGKVRKAIEKSNGRSRELRGALLEICLEASVDRDKNPRVAISKKMAERIFSAVRDTAPWWAKPMVVMAEWTGARKRLSESSTDLEKSALQAPVLAQQTKVKFRGVDHGNAARWSDVDMKTVWERILERTRNHLPTGVPDGELDRATQRLWKEFEKEHGWKAATGAVVLLVGLIVLLTVSPVGWGAAVIGQASIAELLALGGAAGLGSFVNIALERSDFGRRLEEWIYPAYFANLFAFACDGFGLPRDIPGEPTHIILRKAKQIAPACPQPPRPPVGDVPTTGFWSEIPENWKELEQSLGGPADRT